MTQQRRFTSTLRAFVLLALLLLLGRSSPVSALSQPLSVRETWVQSSLAYYGRLTRGTSTSRLSLTSPCHMRAAMETYFAREIIKQGNPDKAERIYRRLIQENMKAIALSEILHVEGSSCADCDLIPLAVPTLLLALHLQRAERINETLSLIHI